MKITKKLMGGTLALAVLTIASTTSAFAYQGDPAVEGPDCSPERHEVMEQAFEANDYAAWAEQMDGKGKATQMVNAENFAQFAKAHALAEEGKVQEANAIRAELGLGLGLKDGSGQGQGEGEGEGKGQGGGQGQGQGKQ